MSDRSTFEAPTFSRRRDALREALRDSGLDGAMITNPASRQYLTGFQGDDTIPVVLAVSLIGPETDRLMTTATNLGWAKQQSPGTDVVEWKRPWEPPVADAIMALGWRNVGYEPQALSVASNRAFLERAGDINLIDLGQIIDILRSVKFPEELAVISRAIVLTDETFVRATAELTQGTTERELAWAIERTMRELGAHKVAFDTIVAAGPHAGSPHHSPTDRPIENGEPVIIDMGASLDGYHADLTRTIWIGEPSTKLREIYTLVSEANNAVRATVREGISGKDADAAARSVFEAGGQIDHATHGVGHGIGVRVHELPSAGPDSGDTLVAGNVMTVEPGLYVPDWGGVRIEDIGVVQAHGFQTLTAAPKMDVTLG